MRAGLATLEVLESEELGRRAIIHGETLRNRLSSVLNNYEMVRSVCGLGLICGIVLKALPPLVVTEAQIDCFVDAIHSVVDLVHSSNTFWSEALGLARRAVHA
jgi:ornithine--oxo-acid transaminase